MAGNGWNDWKLMEMAGNDRIYLEMAGNGWEWLGRVGVAGNG